MELSAAAAMWFLPVVLPIACYVAFSDLQRMKIPNHAVLALAAGFAVLGLLALPLPQYLWQWAQAFIMLFAGIVLNAARLMGAGDAKFMAAAAPFVGLGDLRLVVALFAACLLAGYATHRLVRASPLRVLAPDWVSWTAGKRFPMGFPLAMTLVFYLALVALLR